MIGINRQALNKQFSKYKGLRREPGCTFGSQSHYPIAHESQLHFYSECNYVQRLWTQIKDWAARNNDASYRKMDRILGKQMEDAYSIDNTILRETRSIIQRARYTKTIQTSEP